MTARGRSMSKRNPPPIRWRCGSSAELRSSLPPPGTHARHTNAQFVNHIAESATLAIRGTEFGGQKCQKSHSWVRSCLSWSILMGSECRPGGLDASLSSSQWLRLRAPTRAAHGLSQPSRLALTRFREPVNETAVSSFAPRCLGPATAFGRPE